MGTSIAKNTAFMTIASIGQKIVSFAYFTLIARFIGVEGTGKYFFALSFTTVFVVFVDLGLTNVLVREAAKMKQKVQEYFSTVLSVKMILGVVSYVALIATVYLLGKDGETRELVMLSGVTMLFDSLHLSLYGVLRAIGELKYEAISIVASQLITLSLGSVFLYLQMPLIYLILAFTVSSVLNVVFASFILVKKFEIRILPKFNKDIFVHLGRIAIPFAIAAVFARVYSYIDTILLSTMVGDAEVGIYSVPYKLTFAFQFIPLALIAALYPRFSEHFAHNREKLAYLFERGMKYLMIIAFPIVVGIGVLANDIIVTVFSDQYQASVLPLQILLMGLLFSYLSFPIGAFLNACNKQVTQTVITGIILVVNVAVNVVLIPVYGAVGAAIAATIGNILLTVLGYVVVPKIARVSHSFLLKTVFQLMIASIVMGGLVWRTNSQFHFIFAIIVGALVYPIMLFATGAITREQLKEAMQLVRK